jgi:hypothetical protein
MGRFNWGEGSGSSPDIFDWLYGLILICFVAYFYLEAYLSWQERRSKNLPGKTLPAETDVLIITLAGYAIAAFIATGVVFKILDFLGVVKNSQEKKEVFLFLLAIFFGSLLFFKTKSYSSQTQLKEFSPNTISKQEFSAVKEKQPAQKEFDKKFVDHWYNTGFNHASCEEFDKIREFSKFYATQNDVLKFYKEGLTDGKKYLSDLSKLREKAISEIDFFLSILQALEWKELPNRLFNELVTEYQNAIINRNDILKSGLKNPNFPFEIQTTSENEVVWLIAKIDDFLN